MLPFSVAFLALFNFLSSRLSRKALFNCIVAGFMLFFAIFAFLLFPNTASIHPHALADVWLRTVPSGLAGGVAVLRNWTFSIFYCASEMWGDVGLSLLFWSLANETTSISDAAVLYPLFGIGANVAQVRLPPGLSVRGFRWTGLPDIARVWRGCMRFCHNPVPVTVL